MSYSTVLGVTPDQRPVTLAELSNSHGFAPGIWDRLLAARGETTLWMRDNGPLDRLWKEIEALPEWQQVPLVMTFDTGVIPFQAFAWAAEQLDEFDRRLPAPEGHVNHVPALADIFRSSPEVPLIGVWGTSVSENPFDPWDYDTDCPGSGISLSEMYLLERHRRR